MNLENTINYVEFVRRNREKIFDMTGIEKRFCEENVCRELRKVALHPDSVTGKKWMMIKEKDFQVEQNGTERYIVTCASGAVELAITFEMYDLAKELIEAGMEFHLDAKVVVLFCTPQRRYVNFLELNLLEVLAVYWDRIPSDFYEFLWKEIESGDKWSLEENFDFSYKYTYETNEKFMQSVNYLSRYHEGAAVALRKALARYYLKLFEETLFYQGYTMKVNPIYWEWYQKNATLEEVKETLILIIHAVLEKGIEGRRDGAEDVISFVTDIMLNVGPFGELCVEKRDECVKMLLDLDELDIEWLQAWIHTDFVPTECLDSYIETLQNSRVGRILNLFITEKTKKG